MADLDKIKLIIEAKEKSNSKNNNDFCQLDGKIQTEEIVTENLVHSSTQKERDIPASSCETWVTKKESFVKIREDNSGIPYSTIVTIFDDVAKKIPNHIALAVKRNSMWLKWTYQQYHQDVMKVAKGFIKLGLQPLGGVGILGFNSPEWLMAKIGAVYAGGVNVGIYTTNSPEACQYVLKHSGCNIAVVENHLQLKKILKVWPELPDLKAVVQYTGEVAERRSNIYSWEELLKLSEGALADELNGRLRDVRPNRVCSLVYTSGTTGPPKGVMLSHDNLLAIVEGLSADNWQFGKDVVLSYLPLSHIASQIMDVWGPLRNGATVYFAQPDVFKGTLKPTLLEVRPTLFLSVPRVFDKIKEAMQAVFRQHTGLQKKILDTCKSVGLRAAYAEMNGEPRPTGWTLANILVFKKVKKVLGLDRCRSFWTGGAPITKETLDFYYSLNIPLRGSYGMSENSGPHSIESEKHGFKVGSVGKTLQYMKTRIDNPDKEGIGEICMYGRHVFMGYLNDEEKTRETIDKEGWLHSGDLGRIDEDGFLFITGRIKELIVTAGGENVVPCPIEESVKQTLPVINNCMLVGDHRKFLSILLCLKTVMNVDTGTPEDNLTPDAIEWCKAHGSGAKTVTEVLNHKESPIFLAIQQGIDQVNQKAVSNTTKIHKWQILPCDFSIPGGELGPTMKLRRSAVVTKYEKVIEEFYS